MKSSTIRLLALAGMVGSVLLVITELIEVYNFNLTFTSTPLFLMRLLLQILLGVGVWGIHLGQAERGGKFSLIATIILSAGFFMVPAAVFTLIGEDIVDWAGYFTTEAFNNPLMVTVFSTVVVGQVLFGIALIRARTYPRWTGAFMIAHPIIVIFLFPMIGLSTTDGSILDLILMGLPILWASQMVWTNESSVEGHFIATQP